MRILYDGAIYQWQKVGGINRYFSNLISRLPENFLPVITTSRRRGITYPIHPRLRVFGFERFRPQRLSVKLEKAYLGRVAPPEGFDLIHPTYYTLLSQAEMDHLRRPVVLTFWDMIHDLFPEQDPTGRVVAMKRKAVEAAQVVICISENTKRDLMERYRVPESKVMVTHLASEISLKDAGGAERVPARPYFLYVGARNGYKNFDRLLSAFASVALSEQEMSLCVVGPPFSPAEEKKIAELKLTDRVEHFEQVPDNHLAKLYHRSIAFIYPSLYEGFGIPPLEAMSCGTVVVASNCSSIPEVVGDAGILFDPEDEDELAEILLSLIRNPARRESLIASGRARAQTFSWDKTVNETLDIYRSVVD